MGVRRYRIHEITPNRTALIKSPRPLGNVRHRMALIQV